MRSWIDEKTINITLTSDDIIDIIFDSGVYDSLDQDIRHRIRVSYDAEHYNEDGYASECKLCHIRFLIEKLIKLLDEDHTFEGIK